MINYKIKIQDNFLKLKDFNALNSLEFSPASENGVSYFTCRIDKNKNFINGENSSVIKEIFEGYNDSLLKILEEMNEDKLSLYDYSMISVARTGKNFKFPIHDDTPEKLLSGVIYLDPDQNSGTNFFDNKNPTIKEKIDWKKNRAVFFSREERKTWHSFEGHSSGERKVLIYNLCTRKLKKVFNVENKNYFYGMLRYKLNPYIFKLFKRVI